MSKKRSKLGWPRLRESKKSEAAQSSYASEPAQEQGSSQSSSSQSSPQTPSEKPSRKLPEGQRGGLPELFERPRWRAGMNIFGAVVIICFNIALVGGDLHIAHPNPSRMLFSYLLLVVLDVTWLLPIILEIDRLEIKDNQIMIKTILWRRTYEWSDFTGFTDMSYLKFMALRTRRCCYLINRYHFPRHTELSEILRANVPAPPRKEKK